MTPLLAAVLGKDHFMQGSSSWFDMRLASRRMMPLAVSSSTSVTSNG